MTSNTILKLWRIRTELHLIVTVYSGKKAW